MAMKLARLPNLAASLALTESLTHFLHRGLASRHSQSPKKRRRPHSAHDTHRLLSLSLVYTLTTGSAVPSPPSSASSTRLVHAPAARSLRSARTGGVPTSAIATGSCSRGRPIRGRSIRVCSRRVSHARIPRIARNRGRGGGRFGPARGRESRETRRSGRGSRAATRGGAARRRVRVVESVARVNASYRSPRESHLVVKTVVKTVSVFSNVRRNFRRKRRPIKRRRSLGGIVDLWVKRPFRPFVPLVSSPFGFAISRTRPRESVDRGEGAETLDATRRAFSIVFSEARRAARPHSHARSASSHDTRHAREARSALVPFRGAHVPDRRAPGSRRRLRRGRRRVRAPREPAGDSRGGQPRDGAAAGGGGEDVDGGAHTRALPHDRRERRIARRGPRPGPDGA